MVNDDGPVGLDGIRVAFDDERAVADAGIIVCATLAERLGIERLLDETVRLGDRPGAANAGAKVMSLVSSMALGADCIEDCDLLRVARTVRSSVTVSSRRQRSARFCGRSLSGVFASSTASWARRCGEPGRRAPAHARGGWSSTSTRSSARSSVARSHAPRSATPASAATTRSWPSAPTRARCCTSGSGRARPTPRAGCSASATSSSPVCSAPARSDRSCCAPTRGSGPTTRSSALNAWAGSSRSACACNPVSARRSSRSTRPRGRPCPTTRPRASPGSPRPRSASAGSSSAASAPWIARASCCRPGSCFPSSPTAPSCSPFEAEHRQHALVELAVRDLKDQALAHLPSGRFFANAAWTVIAALAHNLLRWTSVLGLPHRTLRVARTLRRRLLALPGRLTRTARRWTLHLPRRLALADRVRRAVTRVRALPAAG